MSHDEQHKKIGARIRELRYEAGLTVNEISNCLELSPHMVYTIELGIKKLSLLDAEKLAKLFGCKIEDILSEVKHER